MESLDRATEQFVKIRSTSPLRSVSPTRRGSHDIYAPVPRPKSPPIQPVSTPTKIPSSSKARKSPTKTPTSSRRPSGVGNAGKSPARFPRANGSPTRLHTPIKQNASPSKVRRGSPDKHEFKKKSSIVLPDGALDTKLIKTYYGKCNLNGEGLHRIDGLQLFTKIEYLYLRDNCLRTIPELDSLEMLKIVDVSGNHLESLDFLGGLKKLKVVYANDNKLSDNSIVPPLPSVEVLGLSGNMLKTFAPLGGMESLAVLLLSNNRIESFAGFPILPELKSIAVDGNPVAMKSSFRISLLLVAGGDRSFVARINREAVSDSELRTCAEYPGRATICLREGWELSTPDKAEESSKVFLNDLMGRRAASCGALLGQIRVPSTVTEGIETSAYVSLAWPSYEADGTAIPVETVQWYRSLPDNTFERILGATGWSYTPTKEDVGFLLKVSLQSRCGVDWCEVYGLTNAVEFGPPRVESITLVGSADSPVVALDIEYDGGEEGESRVRWWRVFADETEEEVNGYENQRRYVVTEADGGCRLKCEFTPVRADGLVGKPHFVSSSFAIEGVAPFVEQLRVEGDTVEGCSLQAKFELGDTSKSRVLCAWYRSSTEKPGEHRMIASSEGHQSYTLTLSDVGHTLKFKCVPVRHDGVQGDVATLRCAAVKPGLPRGLDVSVSGIPLEGDTLTATYKYFGGVEGTSQLKWLRFPTIVASGLADLSAEPEILDDTSDSHTLTVDDVGCSLVFEYTPVRQDGVAGTPVRSAPSEIINPETPRFKSLEILGVDDLAVGNTLAVKAEYYGGKEGPSEYIWSLYRDNDERDIILGCTGPTYTIRPEDVGCRLHLQAIPIRSDNANGDSLVHLTDVVRQPTPPPEPEVEPEKSVSSINSADEPQLSMNDNTFSSVSEGMQLNVFAVGDDDTDNDVDNDVDNENESSGDERDTSGKKKKILPDELAARQRTHSLETGIRDFLDVKTLSGRFKHRVDADDNDDGMGHEEVDEPYVQQSVRKLSDHFEEVFARRPSMDELRQKNIMKSRSDLTFEDKKSIAAPALETVFKRKSSEDYLNTVLPTASPAMAKRSSRRSSTFLDGGAVQDSDSPRDQISPAKSRASLSSPAKTNSKLWLEGLQCEGCVLSARCHESLSQDQPEYTWYRITDSGKMREVPDERGPSYRLTGADVQHSVRVLLHTADGASFAATSDKIVAAEPCVLGLEVIGRLEEGSQLRCRVAYFGGAEGASQISWRAVGADTWINEEQQPASPPEALPHVHLKHPAETCVGTVEFAVPAEAVSRRVLVEYTPVRADGTSGRTVAALSGQIKQALPTVSELRIDGAQRPHPHSVQLRASATYHGGRERNSNVQWYRSDKAVAQPLPLLSSSDEGSSTNRDSGDQLSYSIVEGAILKTYTPTVDDIGHYLRVKYQPVREDGVTGSPVMSEPIGPIVTESSIESEVMKRIPLGCTFEIVTTDGTAPQHFMMNVQSKKVVIAGPTGSRSQLKCKLSLEIYTQGERGFYLSKKDKHIGPFHTVSARERDILALLLRHYCQNAEITGSGRFRKAGLAVMMARGKSHGV
eukprot:Rmarinus@m.8097